MNTQVTLWNTGNSYLCPTCKQAREAFTAGHEEYIHCPQHGTFEVYGQYRSSDRKRLFTIYVPIDPSQNALLVTTPI